MGLLKERGGLFGAVAGALAAGVGAGLAVEHLLVGRGTTHAIENGETLGSFRGVPTVIKADDEVELYAEISEPDRPRSPITVVFVHGYALNLDCWHFQRQALAQDYRVVAYDQRSHGRSGRSAPEHCVIDQLGSDLARVLDEAAPDGPVVLVGHSMGGMSVMALAEQRPDLFDERVVGVGLIATAAGGLEPARLGVPGPLGSVVHRVSPSFVAALSRAPDLVEHGRKAGSDVGFLLTRHYSFGSKVPPARVEFVAEMLGGTPIEVVAEFFPTFVDHDKYVALPVLQRVETLVVGGEQDMVTPVQHSRDIVAAVPGADYVELADAGHLVLLEHPEIVNTALRQLLARAGRNHRAATRAT